MKKLITAMLLSIALTPTTYGAPTPFKINQKTGFITYGSCHMESCSWAKSVSTTIIQNTPNQAILDVKILGGNSPDVSNAAKKISWAKKPHKITLTCSYQHPSISIGGQLDVLPLNSFGVPRVLESSANLYFAYCHSFNGDISDGIKKFGYNVQPE
ncbi:hypothetical protein [Acinetobacter tjernbergiae]|jgi:hypothetical protein|uniref:Spore coat protein U domain-containing protein n=1 Tax=Acinetobacter tjernbergiae DSM 14971 = CIP 107465 TaxID=1120928 RepID=V2UQU8_9GAMM|nr:hypothetical protein [Acinetobacter tjernbergiae]ESK57123.1 hypothetical protein F990_00597 [Acinetobacter tjernbergiae DSM 14971 = CIP 107465]